MIPSTAQPLSETQLQQDSALLGSILTEMSKVVVGQDAMTRSLLVGLLTGGHVLVEGLPGLAKTLAVKTLASVVDAKFSRVQFTPDLLPSDLIGTMIYREQTGEFVPKKGPIFTHILLADEINRAPAKVQSALLEAMAEKQVTIGESTYVLEEPFLVLATQNPIEQEGTYHLPEAQLDRFMFKIKVEYPARAEERQILERIARGVEASVDKRLTPSKILEMRQNLSRVYLDDRIQEYVLRLVLATRRNQPLDAKEVKLDKLTELRQAIQIGGSPRASIFLCRAAQAHALFENRNFVIPDDVKAVAHEILRHRLILTFEAESRNWTADEAIDQLLEIVIVP